MELKDTVDLMISEDYKERFKAEYLQLKIRCDKLADFIQKKQKNEDLSTSPMALLMDQLHFMKCYKEMLETRATVENIDLSEV